MENNLSLSVKMLCRKQGITMRQLAERMQIAPESLSRAINGNPQLTTIQKIAECLNVGIVELFNPTLIDARLTSLLKLQANDLYLGHQSPTPTSGIEEINPIKVINNEFVAMVRYRNQTLATTDLATLIGFIDTIIGVKQVTDNEDVEEV